MPGWVLRQSQGCPSGHPEGSTEGVRKNLFQVPLVGFIVTDTLIIGRTVALVGVSLVACPARDRRASLGGAVGAILEEAGVHDVL